MSLDQAGIGRLSWIQQMAERQFAQKRPGWRASVVSKWASASAQFPCRYSSLAMRKWSSGETSGRLPRRGDLRGGRRIAAADVAIGPPQVVSAGWRPQIPGGVQHPQAATGSSAPARSAAARSNPP